MKALASSRSTQLQIPCVITVLVTNPAIEISGVAAIFSEKVAVRVTTPEVIMLSESLDEIVRVAFEVGARAGSPNRFVY